MSRKWLPTLLVLVVVELGVFTALVPRLTAQPRRTVVVVPADNPVVLSPTSKVVGVACAASTSNYSTGRVQCFVAIEQ